MRHFVRNEEIFSAFSHKKYSKFSIPPHSILYKQRSKFSLSSTTFLTTFSTESILRSARYPVKRGTFSFEKKRNCPRTSAQKQRSLVRQNGTREIELTKRRMDENRPSVVTRSTQRLDAIRVDSTRRINNRAKKIRAGGRLRVEVPVLATTSISCFEPLNHRWV